MEELFAAGVVVIVVVAVIGVLNLVESFSIQRKELENKGIKHRVGAKHVNGLPISEDTYCVIDSYSDKYEFTADGFAFNLPKDRVKDVSIKKHEEITAHKVSSVAGAIGGAVLFGPLGAIIGGRAKKHEVISEVNYLVFTYLKDEEIKYICFELERTFGIHFATPFVKEFEDNKIKNIDETGAVEIKKIDL